MVGSRGGLTTGVPITYVIDYGDDHLENMDAFIQALAQAPPHLLHVGHDAPFSNTWGAAFLVDRKGSALASPEDIQARTARIAEFLDRLHGIGIQIVIPYICNQTLAGDPEKRLGIWEFYDRWDAYSDLGFGRRPEADPLEWMAREHNDGFHYNYEKRHVYFQKLGQYRFAPCASNPHYNRYQRGIVENIASVGYDGVFVDNCILNCYCAYCQAKFEGYVTDNYSLEELGDRFGFDGPSEVRLGHLGNRLAWVTEEPTFKAFLKETYSDEELERWLGTSDPEEALIEEGGNGWLWGRANEYRKYMEERYSPRELTRMFGVPDLSGWGIRTRQDRALWAETKRFWAKSISDNLAMIKELGAAVRGDFVVVPNWGGMHTIDGNLFRSEIAHDVRQWAPNSDCQMFEEDGDPGRIAQGFYIDYIMQHKFAFANQVRPGMLCYVGQGPSTIELAYAETAAGGGGAFIQAGTSFPEIRSRYGGLFAEHADLFDGYTSYADVALAYFYDQMHLGNLEHIRQVYQLSRYLSDQHILFDYLLEGDLSEEILSPYRILILPEAGAVDDEEVAAVTAFVEQGGLVVLTGDMGWYTYDGKTRGGEGFERLLGGRTPDENGLLVARCGGGRCVYAPGLETLLPGDGLTRDEALHFSRDELVEALHVEGVPSLYAMAQLDKAVGVVRFLEGGPFLKHAEAAIGYSPSLADGFKAAGIRFSAYSKRTGNQGNLVIHAVNYNLPLVGGPEHRTIAPVENVEITLRMPDGWQIQRVEALEAGAEPEELDFRCAPLLQVSLPKITFYKLIHVSAVVQE